MPTNPQVSPPADAGEPRTRDDALFITRAHDASIPVFTSRCRACGKLVKKRGDTSHARSHLGKLFDVGGVLYAVRELIASPRNRYFFAPVPAALPSPAPANGAGTATLADLIASEIEDAFVAEAAGEEQTSERIRSRAEAVATFVAPSTDLCEAARAVARSFNGYSHGGFGQASFGALVRLSRAVSAAPRPASAPAGEETTRGIDSLKPEARAELEAFATHLRDHAGGHPDCRFCNERQCRLRNVSGVRCLRRRHPFSEGCPAPAALPSPAATPPELPSHMCNRLVAMERCGLDLPCPRHPAAAPSASPATGAGTTTCAYCHRHESEVVGGQSRMSDGRWCCNYPCVDASVYLDAPAPRPASAPAGEETTQPSRITRLIAAAVAMNAADDMHTQSDEFGRGPLFHASQAARAEYTAAVSDLDRISVEHRAIRDWFAAHAAPPSAQPDAAAPETFDYPAAARSIALNLAEFCDESLPYPTMIADAARKARRELDWCEAIETDRRSPSPMTGEGAAAPIPEGLDAETREVETRLRALRADLAPHRGWGGCPMTGQEDCCDTLVIEERLLLRVAALLARVAQQDRDIEKLRSLWGEATAERKEAGRIVGEWIEAVLAHYPRTMAFDSTAPRLMVDNVLRRLRERADRAAHALGQYGTHRSECDYYLSAARHSCNCGFAAARAASPTTTEPGV